MLKSMSRRTIALVFGVLAVVALAGVASGVFQHGDSGRRAAAVRYIAAVNAVQRRHARQTVQARLVLQRFAKGKSKPADAASLRAAAAGFSAAARETAALHVPTGLEHVHADV